MANQIYVNSGTGNITVTTSRAVIGTVANVASANYANFAGEVVNASQPNITSLGNLTNLNVTGTTTTGNLIVTGNLQVGNLVANSANYANFAGIANVANTVAGANVTGTVANATFATSAGTANTANSATVANSANAVAGANVSGTVANATFATSAGTANTANSATIANSANSVALANVSGAGNIASINLDGSASNVLYGNGIFAPAAGGNTANANYANFAGTAFSVSGSNVSGEVANANYASYANIANSANSVAVGNVSGIGNIATVNLDGNVSNLLTGNGTFVAIPTGGGGSNISNGTSNVSIPTTNGNIEIYANTEHWTFADTGNLILANGNGVIQSIANSSLDPIVPNVSTMVLTPDQGYTSQALVLDPTTPGHIHLRAPGSNIDQPLSNVYLGGEISSFEVGVFNGAVPNLFIHSNNNTWMFDIDGNLTLPANTFAINYANGTQVPLDGPVANANYANFAGDVVNSSQSNITSVGNLTTLQVGNGTNDTLRFTPTGANLTLSTGNVLVAQNRIATSNVPRDAVVVADGTNYTQQYFAPDGSNVATFGSTIYAIDGTVGSGNAAVEGSITQRLFTAGSNLTTGNIGLSTDYGYTGAGLLLNQKTPATGIQAGTGLIQTISYGEPTDASKSVGLRFQRRRGNNNSRLSLQPNDYVGNIEWRPGRGGSNFGTTAKFGAKVDGGYTANSNPVPIGMEMGVVNSSGAQLTHSFYANGDVSFAGNIISTLPGASSIVNGNSSASFTGAGGDLLINIDNAQYATFFNNRKLQLSGIEGDSGNASQLVLNNGGMQLVQEDLGGGFASFDFKSYFSTGFIAPYTFYRARGNTASPNNVQSGDAIKTESYIVYGDSGNTFLNVGTYSATVTANDNAGNVQSRIEIATARNDNGSEVKLNADKVVLEGNSAIDLNANTNMGSGSLFKLASFTASALNAITGSIGQMAAVSNSGGGGNPNGMIAFWDTTHARWSYIHDNSAV